MIYTSTLIATCVLALLIIIIPRKYMMVPFIIAACFIPSDQRMIISDLDFTPLRIIILIGFFLVLLEGQIQSRLTLFDFIIFAFAIMGAIIYCIQWGTTKSLIHQSGILFDIFGMYIIFSAGLNSWNKIHFALKVFAVCSIVTAFFIAIEWSTGKNAFAVLGKVQTVIRDGRYRCEGPFPHSIISGLFWGMLVPMFMAIVMTDKKSILFKIAIGASIFIVMASASSTPVLSLFIVLAGMFFFKWRNLTSTAFYVVIGILTVLHFIMEKPVWHLLSRMDIVGGSTGWHRYILVDRAITHFQEWALFGCKATEHWGWGMEDITNQFIYEGVRGGFITMLLLIILIFMAFKLLLRASLKENTQSKRLLSWAFFVSLTGHLAAFFAVSYFGQIMMLWYMTLAVTAFFARRNLALNHALAKMRFNRNLNKPILFSKNLVAGNNS